MTQIRRQNLEGPIEQILVSGSGPGSLQWTSSHDFAAVWSRRHGGRGTNGRRLAQNFLRENVRMARNDVVGGRKSVIHLRHVQRRSYPRWGTGSPIHGEKRKHRTWDKIERT